MKNQTSNHDLRRIATALNSAIEADPPWIGLSLLDTERGRTSLALSEVLRRVVHVLNGKKQSEDREFILEAAHFLDTVVLPSLSTQEISITDAHVLERAVEHLYKLSTTSQLFTSN